MKVRSRSRVHVPPIEARAGEYAKPLREATSRRTMPQSAGPIPSAPSGVSEWHPAHRAALTLPRASASSSVRLAASTGSKKQKEVVVCL